MIPIQVQKQFVEDAVKKWMQQDVTPTIEKALARKKRRIPEGLEQEIKQQFYAELGGMGLYVMKFSDAGRMVDMRPGSMTWKKSAISRNENFMSAWAQRYAKRLMKYTPGYVDAKPKSISKEDQLERFANAIIASYGKGKAKRKRRGAWYNKTKNRLINKLIARLSQTQADYMAKHLPGAIKKELGGGLIVL